MLMGMRDHRIKTRSFCALVIFINTKSNPRYAEEFLKAVGIYIGVELRAKPVIKMSIVRFASHLDKDCLSYKSTESTLYLIYTRGCLGNMKRLSREEKS